MPLGTIGNQLEVQNPEQQVAGALYEVNKNVNRLVVEAKQALTTRDVSTRLQKLKEAVTILSSLWLDLNELIRQIEDRELGQRVGRAIRTISSEAAEMLNRDEFDLSVVFLLTRKGSTIGDPNRLEELIQLLEGAQ